VIVTLAVLLPVMADAATTVKLQGSLGVANVTAGNKDYSSETSADYNQVVKLQVFYKNISESSDSNTANSLRVKIAMPADTGKEQTVSSSVKADNSDEVKAQVKVKLSGENARLQYIPGSAVWKHNTGTSTAPSITETKLSDAVALSTQGLAIEDLKPGDAYGATITVLARVLAPGVNVTTESELKGESNKWSTNNSAQAGATLRHIVSYQNTGNSAQKQVIIRDVLPAKVQLVPGTVMLYNTSNSNGVKVADTITDAGINIGNYGPGANAYVIFETTVPPADQLTCGSNELRNTGIVRPEGMSDYYATSTTTVNRDCGNQNQGNQNGQTDGSTATPKPQPSYSCDLLTLTKGDNRKVTAKVDYKADNGAKLKSVTYDFGDGSQPLVTDKTTVDYTYSKDGNFTVSAKLLVTANGKDETVTSAPCAQTVSFAPPAAPASPSAPVSSGLPNSGAGGLIGIFAIASFAGFVLHRVVFSRRPVRE
jgi:uncharacterized repeat protein (TIGR01451 family)